MHLHFFSAEPTEQMSLRQVISEEVDNFFKLFSIKEYNGCNNDFTMTFCEIKLFTKSADTFPVNAPKTRPRFLPINTPPIVRGICKGGTATPIAIPRAPPTYPPAIDAPCAPTVTKVFSTISAPTRSHTSLAINSNFSSVVPFFPTRIKFSDFEACW